LDLQKEPSDEKACLALVKSISGTRFDSSMIRVGRTKVFWKHSANDILESLRVANLSDLVVKIQAVVRGFLARRRSRQIQQLIKLCTVVLRTRDPKQYKSVFLQAENLDLDLPIIRRVRKAFIQIRREQDLSFSLKIGIKVGTMEAIKAALQRAIFLQYLTLNDFPDLRSLLHYQMPNTHKLPGAFGGSPKSEQKRLLNSPKKLETSAMPGMPGAQISWNTPSKETSAPNSHMPFMRFSPEETDHEKILEISGELSQYLSDAIERLRQLAAIQKHRRALRQAIFSHDLHMLKIAFGDAQAASPEVVKELTRELIAAKERIIKLQEKEVAAQKTSSVEVITERPNTSDDPQ